MLDLVIFDCNITGSCGQNNPRQKVGSRQQNASFEALQAE
jgi:hypothetical protein